MLSNVPGIFLQKLLNQGEYTALAPNLMCVLEFLYFKLPGAFIRLQFNQTR